MANTVKTSDIDAFLTDAAWAIFSTYHTVLKASPGAAILVWTCCLTFPSLLTGTKLETTGNANQVSRRNVEIAHAMIGTTTLVIKCFFKEMVSSTNHKVGMKAILGLLHHIIQMGQSGFNTE
jgi:hypothetical protein